MPAQRQANFLRFRVFHTMNYSNLLKKSFEITIRNPALWVFGLFVIGSSNLNFFRFEDALPTSLWERAEVGELWRYFSENPNMLALASFIMLVLAVAGVVVTNWSRIMLVLSVRQLLDQKFLDISKTVPESGKSLKSVIQVSLMTTGLMAIVAAGLLLPPFLIQSQQLQPVLTTIGLVIFLPLAFTISCVNIFTLFFIVLLRKNTWAALNVATDLFVTRWTAILGLTLVLIVIYSACFVAGASLIYLLKLILGTVIESLPLGPSAIPPLLVILRVMAGIIVWVLLGGLNVFFNTSLILLFLDLITPIKAEEKKTVELAPAPAAV
jgi:hypothetical protein